MLRYVRAVPDDLPDLGTSSALVAVRHGLARRDLLRLGLALPVLAGCSASPALGPRPGTSPGGGAPTPGAASPAPAPRVPAAANAEQALSAYAGAMLSGPHRGDLSGAQRRLLTFLRDAHADHAVALAGADPTSRPTTATPSPHATAPDLAKPSLSASLKRLAQQEAAQATAHRRIAATSSGLAALVAGSLSAAADSYAAALGAGTPPSVSAKKARRAAPLLTDVVAAQQLVTQLHAVVYGYQLAIGKLRYTSSARRRAVSELAATRTLLDARIAFLLDHKADVPPAEPAYAPSSTVSSPGEAEGLVRGMQARLEPFVGLTLAAAGTDTARSQALTLLVGTCRTARAWGAPLQAWPGWPD